MDFWIRKKIVGSESVGSAAKVSDPEGRRMMRIRMKKGLPIVGEKNLLIHQKVVCGSEFFTFGWNIWIRIKSTDPHVGYGTYLPIWTKRWRSCWFIRNLK